MKNIVNLYHECLRKDYEAEQAKRIPSGKFSDSNGGFCLRKRVMKRANDIYRRNWMEQTHTLPDAGDMPYHEVPPLLEDLITFRRGNIVHQDWQETIGRYYPEAVTEHRVEDTDTSGRYDLRMPIEGIDILADFKTQKESAFAYARKDPEAKRENQIQLGRYYLKILAQGIPPSALHVVYISKGDFVDELEREIDLPKAIALAKEDLRQEQDAWKTYTEKGELPPELPIEFDEKRKKWRQWQCEGCTFYKNCTLDARIVNKYEKAAQTQAAIANATIPEEVKT